MLFVLYMVVLGCTDSKSDTADTTVDNPIFSVERIWDIPQRSTEWWEQEDERSSVFAGAGALMEDIDRDGLLDLVLLRRGGVHILRNLNGQFETMRVPEIAGLPANGSIVDWDQDGDMDLFLNTAFGEDALCRWDDVWSVEYLSSSDYSAASTWYDVNNDGLLDLLSAGYGNDHDPALVEALQTNTPHPGEDNALWIQQSDHSFVRTEDFEGNDFANFSFSMTMLPFQQQNDWDLLVVNDFGHLNGAHQLFSLNDGLFTSVDAGHGLDVAMYGMGIDATDLNDDLIPDVFITNIDRPVLLTSLDGTWVDSTLALGFDFIEERQVCWGVDWYDVNNDGHEDLWVGCGPLTNPEQSPMLEPQLYQPDALYLWTDDGYQDVAFDWGVAETTSTRAGGFADFNNDGCAELVRVPRDGPTQLFEGACPSDHQWLDIRLDDGNHGIGATIVVRTPDSRQVRWMTAGGTSFATFTPLIAHFGFGAAGLSTVDVEVTWRDGSTSSHTVDLNQRITLTQ